VKPAEAVLKFLQTVGRDSEAEFYLELFRSSARESFAAIAVDPSMLEFSSDAVALDLRFLSELDLTPVVLVGLHETGEPEAHAERLARALAAAGVSARLLEPGAAEASVASTARSGSIPILPLVEPDERRRLQALGRLLSALHTRKLIFLLHQGGLRPGGELLSVVNLSRQFEWLMACADLSPAQRALVERSRQLIFELVSHKLIISVTAPLDLLRGLFTVRGAGTLLRKGVRVNAHSGYETVDVPRLRALLEHSFGRAPADGFFHRPISRAYLEEDYRGAVLLADSALGAYLTKFAVTREAQGEGIGHDLWQCVTEDYPTLVWRARPDNPIASWYEKQCDGRVRAGEWIVFFKGLAPSRIPEAVGLALAQPLDF
jgi:GNAT superfamily N-acetyltransferase